MKLEKINFMLLIVVVVGLLYVAFYQPNQQRAKMKRCFDTAVAFEKARHYPTDDLTVTNHLKDARKLCRSFRLLKKQWLASMI
jgi:FtsZ-interacting cell division protein ZipA